MLLPNGRSALLLSSSSTVVPSSSSPQEKPLHSFQQGFKYDRASPAVRWPHWHQQQQQRQQEKLKKERDEEKLTELLVNQESSTVRDPYLRLARLTALGKNSKNEAQEEGTGGLDEEEDTDKDETEKIHHDGHTEQAQAQSSGEEGKSVGKDAGGAPVTLPTLTGQSDYMASLGKQKRGRMSRLALMKATDWREKVQRLCDAVCHLSETESVADLLNKWPEQLAPNDYCFLVKQVGYTHWQRALELFEWLNMRHWYTPNNRMLSAILGVLGRANQVALAEEIFQRVEPELGDCVQVFNAMLGVHARRGNWERMQALVRSMLQKGCERDLITYNTLISGRAKAGLQPGMALELLREIWQAGLRPDTVTYNTLISVSSQNKCYEDAVMIYDEMKEQKCQADVWTYNSMISVYGRCGLDEAAEEVYLSMKSQGFSPDAITYNSILFAYAHKGRVEHVDAVRKEMQDAGCGEDVITYNTIIDMYAQKNLHEKALGIYEQMKKIGHKRPDMVTFVVLVDGLGKAGRVHEAERVFREMREETNLKPSLRIFSAMICAYAKVSMYEKAVGVYQEMLKEGIRPDQLAFSVMLDVYLNLGRPIDVLSIYESMMQAKHKPGLVQSGLMLQLLKREGMTAELHGLSEQIQQFGFNPSELCHWFAKLGLCDAAERAFLTTLSRGQPLDMETIDLLLNCFAKAHRLDDAQALVNSISAPVLETVREQLVIVLANCEKFEAAEAELAKLAAAGKTPSRKAFRTLIVGYETAGMAQEAVQTLQKMQDVGLSPDAVCCRSALLAYCRADKPDQGYHLLQRIQEEFGGPKDATLHLAVMKSYVRLQQWEKSEAVFSELQETNLPIFPKDYNSLLLGYAHHGRSQQVQKLMKEMVEKDGSSRLSLSASDTVLEALVRNGRFVEVDEVYQWLVHDVGGFDPDLKTHILMLNAYARHGYVEKAKSLYQRLRHEEGHILQVEVFNVVIGMFSKAGWVDEAELVMKDMQESGFQPNIFCYNAMISVYSKVRSFKKATRVFKGMQACGCVPDTVTYNTLIHLYSRCLHIQEAHSLLQQMKRAGCEPDLASYTLLLTACGQLQMWEAAEALFKEMQTAAGIRIDEATYHLMIDIYRRAGRPELTQAVVTEMKNVGFEPSISTMHMLLDSYGKGGQTKVAEAVLDDMIEAGLDVNVSQYTSLVDGYLKEGEYATAVSTLIKMESEGVKANFVTWTCVVGAASKCETRDDALMLLRALRDVGFPLPLQ